MSTPPKIQSVTLNASPQLQFDSLAPVCQEVLPFGITSAKELYPLPGSAVYSGDGMSSDGEFNPAIALPGRHPVTYTFNADNGCSASQTRIMVVFPTPMVDAGPDRYLLEGGDIVLDASASGKWLRYLWTPVSYLNNDTLLNPDGRIAQLDITYTLTVTSSGWLFGQRRCICKDIKGAEGAQCVFAQWRRHQRHLDDPVPRHLSRLHRGYIQPVWAECVSFDRLCKTMGRAGERSALAGGDVLLGHRPEERAAADQRFCNDYPIISKSHYNEKDGFGMVWYSSFCCCRGAAATAVHAVHHQ